MRVRVRGEGTLQDAHNPDVFDSFFRDNDDGANNASQVLDVGVYDRRPVVIVSPAVVQAYERRA